MESNEPILEMKNSVSISDCESPDPVLKFAVINRDSQMSKEYSWVSKSDEIKIFRSQDKRK